MRRFISVLFCCLVSWYAIADDDVNTKDSTAASSSIDSELIELVNQLPNTKLNKMQPLVENIAAIKSHKTREVLQILLAGDLYYLKSDKTLVNAQKQNDGNYQLTNILTDEALAPVKKRAIRKIRSNNRLRSAIRSFIAKIDLTDDDKSTRYGAVEQLLEKPSQETLDTMRSLLPLEKDADVANLMQTVLLIEQLKHGKIDEQLSAVAGLKSSLEPVVLNTLSALSEELSASEKTQEQEQLLTAMSKAIATIESKRSNYKFIENVFFGLSLGSVLLLAAIGLAITFGVMGVINMAHGEMIMLGAYTTYVVQLVFPNLIEYSLLIAVPAAFVVTGLVGILIERGVIRFLKGRPLETLLATFGISLILQQLVRTVFSPLNRQVQSPEWMTGSWQINPVFSLTFNRLYIILFAIMVFFTLLMILKKSSLGLHVRAVSQNREMAKALSIKSDWVDAITFGLGSGIAGIAGVVLSQLTNVGPNLGQAYIIDSFLVVVFGGVGNLWGTLVAAMSLGSINKFLEPITGSVLANIIVLVGLVLFIQKRPKGLFPQKGRAVD
ncbi:urea ABC transporter permease subunit UrtB [Agaribacter marinus]|uniref:Branched-chain amino acid ABC transporter permease n=1 Tax=Agaribacter marinus TaxID=1431249 RepID=A0AA37WJ01_9ALTE|nr:urea ABC transporter permease subunit UrtB [Agaribacter marinus]GLR71658.1 branched-chain amino acid ABC transporter permease [Agaribacter marinus]